jgi:NADH-quinone oxidoreductase subunit J
MNFTFLTIFLLIFLSGLALTLSKKLIYNATALLVILLLVAVIFIIAEAEFLAVSQIIIYVGGILILILFGIIITQEESIQKVKIAQSIPGFIISVGTFGILVNLILKYGFEGNLSQGPALSSDLLAMTNSHIIGILLMSKYIIALEFVALLLLVALIGSVIIGGRKSNKT